MTEDGTGRAGRDVTGGATGVDTGLGRWAATTLAIGRATVRQALYRHTRSRRRVALLLLGTVAFLPVLGLVLLGVYRVGDLAGSGTAPPLRDLARWVYPAATALVVANGAVLLTDDLLTFDARPLLRSTVPDRTLVLALLTATLGRAALLMALPSAALFVAFGAGAGSVLAGLVAYLVTLTTVLSGALVGVVCGLVGRAALYRLALRNERRALLGTVAKGGFLLLLSVVGALAGARLGAAEVEATGLEAVAPSGPPPVPLGYVADWLFVATPLVDGLGTAALVGGAAIVGLIPVSLSAIVALAPRLWYAEPASPDTVSETAGHSRRPLLRWVDGSCRGRLRVVLAGLVRRTVRRPRRLVFLAYHLVVPLVLGAGLLVGGGVGPATVLGGGLVLLGVWFAGAVFCLNPLGEEGPMLGQLVRSPTPASTLVGARVLAGVLVGAPPVGLGVALLGLGAVPGPQAALLGGYWLALCPASAGIALGVGTLLPATEARDLLDAVTIRAPDPVAIVAHGALVGLLAVAAPLAVLGPVDTVGRVAAGTALVLATAVAGHGGFRYAVSGLADHGRSRRPDRVLAVEVAIGTALAGLVCSEAAGLGVATVATTLGVDGFARLVSVVLGQYGGWAAVVAGAALLADPAGRLAVTPPDRGALRTAVAVAAALLGLWATVAATASVLDLPVAGHALGASADGPGQLAVLVGLLVLVAAPIEEALFRGVIQRRLGEALPRRRAIGVAAVVFGLVHLPVYAGGGVVATALPLTVVTAAGAGFGVVYDRTGNLPATALCHGLFNAVQLAATLPT